MLSDWLPSRDGYTYEILDLERPPAYNVCARCHSEQTLFRCKECFSGSVLCLDCCFLQHRETPLHSIEKWTGHFFQATSLNEEGFVLHIGHGGAPCPKARTKSGSQSPGVNTTPTGQAVDGGIFPKPQQADGKKTLVVVGISGVHQLHIDWCQCQGAPGLDIQLLRSRLFPASVSNLSTAFTFGLLNYFHIDSVECKTSASSFFSKL